MTPRVNLFTFTAIVVNSSMGQRPTDESLQLRVTESAVKEKCYFCWDTADAEINLPSDENPGGVNGFHFVSWIRSEYRFACLAHCQELLFFFFFLLLTARVIELHARS